MLVRFSKVSVVPLSRERVWAPFRWIPGTSQLVGRMLRLLWQNNP